MGQMKFLPPEIITLLLPKRLYTVLIFPLKRIDKLHYPVHV